MHAEQVAKERLQTTELVYTDASEYGGLYRKIHQQ